MRVEYFISKAINHSRKDKGTVSAPISKIASLAVAISLIMMLVSVATGFGLKNEIQNKLAALSGHIFVTNFDNNQSDISVAPIEISPDNFKKIKDNSNVLSINKIITKAAVIRTEETFEGIVFKGVDHNYNWNYLKPYLSVGKFPKISDKEFLNEVLISEAIAQKLKLKLNDTIETYFLKNNHNSLPKVRGFIVSGIYNSGFKELDQTFIIGDIKHAQRLNNWTENQIGNLEIFVRDFKKVNQTNQEIYERLPSDLNSLSVAEKFSSIFQWLSLFDFNINLILFLMLLIAVINMIVVLLVLILERVQMIGLLKTLGAGNWTIRKIFLISATKIVTRGLLMGNITGLGILTVQKVFKIIPLDPNQYYVNTVPVDLNLGLILSINFSVIIICYLLLIIPSYLISKISPSSILRFE